MKKVFLALLLLQLCATLAFSTPTNEVMGSMKLTGTVTDESGNPLIGATVMLDGYMLGTTTNTHGEFTLNRLAPTSYTVSVSYIGYKTQHVAVDLTENTTITVKMPMLAVLCDEVVVSATRAGGRMPIAQSTMNRDELRSNSTAADIPVMLNLLPSVVSCTEGGGGIGNTSFRIRGTDMTRINVTINSIPLNEAESQGVFWVNMPDFASSVDNVQVQRGVGTSTNGAAAFGATVNFQTSSVTDEPFGSIDMMYGSFRSFKSAVRVGTGLMNNGFSFEGRASKVQSDGYIDRGGSNHKSLFATAAWHGERSLVRFNLIHGEQHTDITWVGTPSTMLATNRTYNPAGKYTDPQGNTQFYDNQTDNYWQTHYHLLSSHAFTNELRANITLHATSGHGYYEEYKVGRKLKSYYGLPPITIGDTTVKKADFVHRKHLDNFFLGAIASINYNSGAIDATMGGGWNRYNGDHFGNILWSSVNNGIAPGYEWYRNNGLKTDWNVFAKAIWQPIDELVLFADVQYRGIGYDLSGTDSDLSPLMQQHKWGFVNPKLGASLYINSANEMYLSAGIANREPTRADIKDAMKGAVSYVPKAERLIDLEMGYRFKHQTVAFNINLYYMKYKDQLVLTGELSDVGYPLMDNVPSSYRAGAEMVLGLKPVKWLRWDINTTISRNIIDNFVEYVDLYDNSNDWNSLPQEKNSLGNTTISFSPAVVGASILTINPLKSLSLAWVSKYVGEQYIDNTQSSSRKLNAYWVNDLRAEYKVKLKGKNSLLIQGIVNNVLNTKYEANAWVYRAKFQNDGSEYREDGYFPQAGINFALRLGVEF